MNEKPTIPERNPVFFESERSYKAMFAIREAYHEKHEKYFGKNATGTRTTEENFEKFVLTEAERQFEDNPNAEYYESSYKLNMIAIDSLRPLELTNILNRFHYNATAETAGTIARNLPAYKDSTYFKNNFEGKIGLILSKRIAQSMEHQADLKNLCRISGDDLQNAPSMQMKKILSDFLTASATSEKAPCPNQIIWETSPDITIPEPPQQVRGTTFEQYLETRRMKSL